MTDRPKEKVNGPILCAICLKATGEGNGFQYDLTDKRGHKLYAFVHGGDCDQAFKKTLSNPDIPLEDSNA